MRALYLLSVWTHIVAATLWIGGMFFLVLVVVPWLRAKPRDGAAVFLRETGRRFRNVGWSCFVVLVITGTFNLWFRGVRLSDFVDAQWLVSPFGRTVIFKLSSFALVLVMSALHDFSIGPRATEEIERAPRSFRANTLRRRASWVGRVNGVLSLVLVALGVVLVRGSPW